MIFYEESHQLKNIFVAGFDGRLMLVNRRRNNIQRGH